MLSAALTRLLLRHIKWQAEAGSITLEAALKAFAQARVAETATGKVLVGTAVGGHSVNYMLQPGMSPVAVSETISFLLDLYERLTGATPAPADDAARFSAMMAELQPISETYNDFTSLSVPGTLYDRAL